MNGYFTGNQKLGVFLLVGLGLLGWELYSAAKSYEASSWPTVTATVSKSQITRTRSYSHRKGRSSNHHTLEIEYDYRVRGKSYSNDRVTFGQTFLSDMLGSILQTGNLKKYPKGKMVTVRYNPDSPQDSVIETALPVSAYVVMFASVIMIGLTAGPVLMSE